MAGRKWKVRARGILLGVVLILILELAGLPEARGPLTENLNEVPAFSQRLRRKPFGATPGKSPPKIPSTLKGVEAMEEI